MTNVIIYKFIEKVFKIDILDLNVRKGSFFTSMKNKNTISSRRVV